MPGLATATIAGLILATLGPSGWRPDPAGNADLDRLFGFLVAGLALGSAFPGHRVRAATGLAVFAVALEALQALVPGRDPAIPDLLIKVVGGLVGVAAVAAIGPPRAAPRDRLRRLAPVGALLVAGVAGALWWFDAPVAAARSVHAVLLGDRQPAAMAIGGDPVIDVWGRSRDGFNATIRRADCTGRVLVVRFQRHGWSWQAIRTRTAAARPLDRQSCKSPPSQ